MPVSGVVFLLCVQKLRRMVSTKKGGDFWLCRFNVRLNPAVFCSAVCVPFRFLLYFTQCRFEKAIIVPTMGLKL